MSETLRGLGVSPGIALGPAFVVEAQAAEERAVGSPTEEQAAYEAAVTASVTALERLAQDLRAGGLEELAGIMDAQRLMLQDPGWVEMVTAAIAGGATAIEAVRTSGEHFAATFEALDDPYMAARAADVRDVAGRLARSLAGESLVPSLAGPSIVIAHELTPSQTAELDRALVLGFATDMGSSTSHTAILARALGIPAVVGLTDVSARVYPGAQLALDGERGTIVLDPSDAARREYAARAEALERTAARLASLRGLPAETLDGRRLTLAANIGSPDDVPAALEVGAEGVGLFRTEFLFAGRTEMPSEAEQQEAYRAVLAAMPEHRVVVRTLDVGGDKPLPYLPQPSEENPFLGERGVRYTLAHPEVLRVQLRAMLEASSAGRLSIMVPMVSELAELQAVRAMLDELRREVGGEAELGIMVEIPAAAILAGSFARHSAFLSAGTNDLTQYTLAVDRGNEMVAPLYQPLHPSILRLLRETARGAHEHGRWAGVCGEMAGDLLAIPLLIGLEFDELSMTPSRIPAARERIRSLDAGACRELAEEALRCDSADQVEELVERRMPAEEIAI